MEKKNYSLEDIREALKNNPAVSFKEQTITEIKEGIANCNPGEIGRSMFYVWPQNSTLDIELLNKIWKSLLPGMFQFETKGFSLKEGTLYLPKHLYTEVVGTYTRNYEIEYTKQTLKEKFADSEIKSKSIDHMSVAIFINMYPTGELASAASDGRELLWIRAEELGTIQKLITEL